MKRKKNEKKKNEKQKRKKRKKEKTDGALMTLASLKSLFLPRGQKYGWCI
jgi:hypothetical protein